MKIEQLELSVDKIGVILFGNHKKINGIVSPGATSTYMMEWRSWVTFHMVPSLKTQDFIFVFKILVLVIIEIWLLCPIPVAEKWLLCPLPVTGKWLLCPILVTQNRLPCPIRGVTCYECQGLDQCEE